MMKKLKVFFLTAIFGGLTVIMPIAIFSMVTMWLMRKILVFISPLTLFLASNSNLHDHVANIIVIIILIFACFFVGLIGRTRLGKFVEDNLDKYLLKRLPGYTLVKDTIVQLIGSKETPFSKVALIKLYGDQVRFTAFVTDEHVDGSYTVFIPTGPNPTSGNICHLPKESVEIIDVTVETAMKSVIGCGVGSKSLIEKSKN